MRSVKRVSISRNA